MRTLIKNAVSNVVALKIWSFLVRMQLVLFQYTEWLIRNINDNDTRVRPESADDSNSFNVERNEMISDAYDFLLVAIPSAQPLLMPRITF